MRIELNCLQEKWSLEILFFKELENAKEIFAKMKKGELEMSLINPKLVI